MTIVEIVDKMNVDKLLMWVAGGLFTLFLVVGGWAYTSVNERIDANTRRVDAYNERIDALMEAVSKTQSDISYIRGSLEAENRINRDRE
jgi:transcription elongation factor Elf1